MTAEPRRPTWSGFRVRRRPIGVETEERPCWYSATRGAALCSVLEESAFVRRTAHLYCEVEKPRSPHTEPGGYRAGRVAEDPPQIGVPHPTEHEFVGPAQGLVLDLFSLGMAETGPQEFGGIRTDRAQSRIRILTSPALCWKSCSRTRCKGSILSNMRRRPSKVFPSSSLENLSKSGSRSNRSSRPTRLPNIYTAIASR